MIQTHAVFHCDIIGTYKRAKISQMFIIRQSEWITVAHNGRGAGRHLFLIITALYSVYVCVNLVF